MDTLLLYLIKMFICSLIVWVYYALFLRDKTFHHYNRFYLVIGVLLSLVLPLLKMEYFTIKTDNRIWLLFTGTMIKQSVVKNDFWTVKNGVLSIGVSVSVFFLVKFFSGIFQIINIKKKHEPEKLGNISFYKTELENAPFSYFRSLFWKKSLDINSEIGQQILKHEMVHIEEKHSHDKFFIQLVQSVFWFNPIFYFIKKEIYLIHEYLADKKALKHNDTRAFAQMLLASQFSGNILPATSPFLSSNLKKRLKMLTQKKTKFSYARRLLALPILSTVAFAYLVHAENKEIKRINHQVNDYFVASQTLSKKGLVCDTLKLPQSEVAGIKLENLSKIIEKKSAELNKLKPGTEAFNNKANEISSLATQISELAEQQAIIAQEQADKAQEAANEAAEIAAQQAEEAAEQAEQAVEEARTAGQEAGNDIPNREQYQQQMKLYKEQMKKYKEQVKSSAKNWSKNQGFISIPPVPPLPPLPQIPEISIPDLDITAYGDLDNKTRAKLQKIKAKQQKLKEEERTLLKDKGKVSQLIVLRNNSKSNTKRAESFSYSSDSKDRVFLKSLDGVTKFYINDKEVTKEEVEKLPADKISTVNISKNKTDGKESGIINITTK